MQGKTKGFIEDIFVLLFIAAVVIAAYFFFFSEEKKELQENTNKVTQESTKLQTVITESKKIVTLPKEINTTLNHKTIQEKQTKPEEILSKELEIENKVDLDLLQKFLIGTKQKIYSKITMENQEFQTSKSLKIRLTVLKSGELEKIEFTSGDKELYELNKQKIIDIFPVEIDKKIEAEFPRYLRYKFQFLNIEE